MSGSATLDDFLPDPDIRRRHSILVHAPADLVFDAAQRFDMTSVPLIRLIFRLRARLLGARTETGHVSLTPRSLLQIGWGTLTEQPGRLFIAGAACRPWQADVVFQAVAPARFRTYSEPDQVKIAWTLEAEPLAADLTRLATETRAVATDPAARARFRRYWRVFGVGIVAIRWLLLPALRREAEREWRHSPRAGARPSRPGSR